jgi:hypothetical protein
MRISAANFLHRLGHELEEKKIICVRGAFKELSEQILLSASL